jgi:hypothetical protein
VANTFLWSVTGGVIIGANNSNTVNVNWGSAGSGVLNLTQTSNLGCAKTISQNITILSLPTGSILYHY